MTLKNTLIRSTTPAPPKLIVYGPPGVGKTTFAASADAVLLDCENGAGAVQGLTRTPYLESWPQMRQWLVEFAQSPPGHGVNALAIDTLDWMIQRVVEHVVLDLDGKARGDVTNTLGTAHGGYFKAREIVQNIVYRDLLPMLNAIVDHGVPIILLAHAANTKLTTPEGYDQRLASPDIPHWIAPTFVEWSDGVLYARCENGQRSLLTSGTNVVLAKNRYGLPPEIPLSWPALVQSLAAARPTASPDAAKAPPMQPLRLVGGDAAVTDETPNNKEI